MAGLYLIGGFVSHVRETRSEGRDSVRATNESLDMSQSRTDSPEEKTHARNWCRTLRPSIQDLQDARPPDPATPR